MSDRADVEAPLRVMLDSMIPDVLAVDEALMLRLRDLVAAGRLEVLLTHVQVDELMRTPDTTRRGSLLNPLFLVGARSVETSAFVLGADPDPSRPEHRQPFGGSRLGMARLGGDKTNDFVSKLTRGKVSEIDDALITVTARSEGAVLITDERRRHRLPGLVPGLEVWSTEELREWVARSVATEAG